MQDCRWPLSQPLPPPPPSRTPLTRCRGRPRATACHRAATRSARRPVAQRQPTRQPQPGAALRGEGAADWLRLPGAGDGERAVQAARRQKHRGAHAEGARQPGASAHQARESWRGGAGAAPRRKDGDHPAPGNGGGDAAAAVSAARAERADRGRDAGVGLAAAPRLGAGSEKPGHGLLHRGAGRHRCGTRAGGPWRGRGPRCGGGRQSARPRGRNG